MRIDNGNGSRAASARGFMALFAMLAVGLGLMASPAEAAPFAYVANFGDGTASVIDTATNPPSVVATVTVGANPFAVAVTPDGKHAYVTNETSGTVSVIDTATNSVVATVGVGNDPRGVAVTPDGTHVYVTNFNSNTVSVIAAASNTVVATIPVGINPIWVAVTPDGTHAYVANFGVDTVSVIATATNTVGSLPLPSLSRRMANRPMSRILVLTPFRLSTRPPTRWSPRSSWWGITPQESRLLRMENTSMSRIMGHIMSR